MGEFTVKRIDDMEAVFFGAFKRARAELGVSAFGLQVIDMPPNADQYPEHSHADDGQEEVYLALRGSGEIEIEGERHRIDPETMVRIGPGTTRKVWTSDEPLRLVIIGGVPGNVYEPPAVTLLGAPDPAAS
jgi:quercetin dioxygenase-like cupin family protein